MYYLFIYLFIYLLCIFHIHTPPSSLIKPFLLLSLFFPFLFSSRIPTGEWKMMTQIILYDIPPFVAAQKLHLEVYRVDEKKVGGKEEEKGGKRRKEGEMILISFSSLPPLGNHLWRSTKCRIWKRRRRRKKINIYCEYSCDF